MDNIVTEAKECREITLILLLFDRRSTAARVFPRTRVRASPMKNIKKKKMERYLRRPEQVDRRAVK